MWCATCQAPVGQASEDQPAACPKCGTALTDPPSATTATEQAHELLKHWATDNPLDLPSSSRESQPTTSKPATTGNDQPRRQYRVDTAHAKHQQQSDTPETVPPPTSTSPATKQPPRRETAAAESNPDSPVTETIPPPNDPLSKVASTLANFSIDSQSDPNPMATRTDSLHHPESASSETTADTDDETATVPIPAGVTTSSLTHSTSLWGQLLAYVGVLGLTAGGALIVWNGFGHAPVNTPTSWLIATGGQMLLFLGIVTLVSSGLEQTNEDVNRQVRLLSEQLKSIEQRQANPTTATPHLATRSDTLATHSSNSGATKPK